MKRFSFILLGLALASCGGNERWNNQVTTPRATLAEVAPPHVPVVVYTSGGLYQMFLDTGSRQSIAATDAAVPLGANALLDIENGHYVVTRADAPRLVIEEMTPQKYVDVAPDRKHIALAEGHTIVVADVITGAVKRYDLPDRDGDAHQVHWLANDSVYARTDTQVQLDIATGAVTPAVGVDELEWLMAGYSPDLPCPEHGFTLQKRTGHGRQEIVLVPTASTANPEELSSLETRVLVQTTDKSGHSGDGAINLGKKNPEPLSLDALLPSCEHFVFSLEGKTFVGNITSGKIAFVGFGWGAIL